MIKLKVGKQYMDRTGSMVMINSADGPAPWIYVGIGTHGMEDYWRPDGSYSIYNADRSEPEDLIEEVGDSGEPEYVGPLATPETTDAVLDEVFEERERQEKKWGVQNHDPMVWLAILAEEFGEVAKDVCDSAVSLNKACDYTKMLAAYKNYRAELVQVAAVAVAMIESYDRGQMSMPDTRTPL
jgi:hypothetical protein